MTHPTSKEETPTLRVRRYLPYLGIYASDVRSVVERVEALEIELARAIEHNGALVELAKTATRDAVEEAKRLLLTGDGSAPETSPRPKCEECKQEIDPDWCWCGDAIEDHKGMSHNHSPVRMGCTCGMRLPPLTQETSTECQGCKEGWQLSQGWHWDSIGHMHRCTAQEASPETDRLVTPSQGAWYCGYTPCRQLNSAWANACGRCGRNKPAENGTTGSK